jgi:fructoselysine and glucoselysine-specific PTS system IIB component
MIVGARVDHRLLHGQVTFTWLNTLSANAVLVVSDTLLDDAPRLSALSLSKPAGTKLVVKTVDDAIEVVRSGVTDTYRVFVIADHISAMRRLTAGLPDVITSVNLGQVQSTEGSEKVTAAVWMTPEQRSDAVAMVEAGIEVFAQQVPADSRVDLSSALASDGSRS